LKPARFKPPWKRACSIFTQRSITTVMPRASATSAASSDQMPNCNQKYFAPIAAASLAIAGVSSARRKTSATSHWTGISAKDAYTGCPKIWPPFCAKIGFTTYTSYVEEANKYVETKYEARASLSEAPTMATVLTSRKIFRRSTAPGPTHLRSDTVITFSLGLIHRGSQRLVKIPNNVVDVFNTHRNTYQIIRNTGSSQLLIRQLLVSSRARMQHQRFSVTDIGQMRCQLQISHKRCRRLPAALHTKTKYRTDTQGQQLFTTFVVRMICKTSIIYIGNALISG